MGAIALGWLLGLARAQEPPPPDLGARVLADPAPSAWTPFDVHETDWTVIWDVPDPSAAPGAELQAEVVEGSVQWVRVSEVLVVPRVRLFLRVAGLGSAVAVRVAGTDTLLPSTAPELAEGEVEVPLWAGGTELWVVSSTPGLAPLRGRLVPPPRGGLVARRDPSCSRWRVELGPRSDPGAAASYAYVGCHAGVVKGREGDRHELDVVVFWNGGGGNYHLVGSTEAPSAAVPVQAAPPAEVITVRMTSATGPLVLQSDTTGDRLELEASIPDREHAVILGAALGPLLREDDGALAPGGVLRLHAIALLAPTQRAVVFGTVLGGGARGQGADLDLGGFYESQLLALFDGRLRVDTLLGAHLQQVDTAGQAFLRFSAPQGVELWATDVVAPSYWMRVGGFLQPPVADRWYAQTYLRFGRTAFVELNATAWKLPTTDLDNVQRTYAGALVGVPLARIL